MSMKTPAQINPIGYQPAGQFEETRFEKIHNPKFSMYQNLDTIEEKIKKKFGTKFSQTDISNLEAAISESFQNFDISSLNVFINENFYNYGNTIDYIDENFLDICI